MTEATTFQVAHPYEVLTPKSDQAYPIPCREWDLLKSKVEQIRPEPWWAHTSGSLLLGMSASCLITLISGQFDLPEEQRAMDISVIVMICTAVGGFSLLWVADAHRKAARMRTQDVTAMMSIIEDRFPRE